MRHVTIGKAIAITLAAIIAASAFVALEVRAAPTAVQIGNGGTGTTTGPAFGQVLVGGKNGEYEYAATSTFGGGGGGGGAVSSVFGRTGVVTAQSGDYTTSLITEGSNLYYTAARSLADFIANLAATTSVKSIVTLPNLSLPYSQLTGTPDLSQYFTLSAWYSTTTDQLKEGNTNLYFTNARSDARFITDLAATTSVKSITTLPTLSLPYSQLTGTPTNVSQFTNDAGYVTSSFSTTSANYWSTLGLGFSTTSANYWGSTKGYLTSLAGAASSTLLGDTNTFSGTDKFNNAIIIASLNGLIAGNSGSTYASATTSASCTGNASCSAFTVLGSTPVTINVAAGTAASSTLLSDANTFSGIDKFTNASSDFSGTWQTFTPSHFDTFAYPFLNSATSSTLTFSGGLVSNGSTTIAGLSSGLVGNNNGLLYGFASSSLFGYTPLNPTRNVNTTFPLQGGGALTSDLTLTNAFGTTSNTGLPLNQLVYTGPTGVLITAASSSLSLPSSALQNTTVTAGSYTNTNLTVNAQGQITAASNGSGGSSFAFPWNITTVFGTTTRATTTPEWFQTGLFASSTIAAPNQIDNYNSTNGTTTNSTSTNLYVSGQLRNGNLNGIMIETSGVVSVSGGNACGAGTVANSLGNAATVGCTNINNSFWSGTQLSVGNGGTGQQTFTSSQLLYGNGTAALSSVGTSSLGVTGPITFSGTIGAQVGGAGGNFGCTSASSGVTGCLTGADWNTFNGKQAAGTYLTGLGSGWATTTATSITFSTSTLTTNGQTFGIQVVPANGSLTFTPTVTGTYSGQAGSVANALTFNNGGAGAASGQTFNGSGAATISYNTIGAQVAGSYDTFAYPFLLNATTTGLGIYASSTIGDGSTIGGLTVSGTGTTTGAFNAATNQFNINSSGQISKIGNTSVTISGSSFQMGASGSDVLFQNNVSTLGSGIKIQTTPVVGGNTDRGSAIKFFIGTNERARFDGSGGYGFGTTSPYAEFSIATPNGASGASTTLFAIASSTATATTTLFTVDNTGTITTAMTGTQCVHEVSGVLSGTGSDCGSGSGSGFSTTSADYHITATTTLPSITTLTGLTTLKNTFSGPLAANTGVLYNFTTSTLNIGGNAGTATALAANGTNCAAGFFPLGVDASGNIESCTYAFATTTPWAADQFMYLNHTGQGVTAASSSFFGYTPLNPTRNVNTTYPVTGGGDLSADRTIALAFGTTTANTWSGLQTFTSLSTTTFAGPVALSGFTLATSTTICIYPEQCQYQVQPGGTGAEVQFNAAYKYLYGLGGGTLYVKKGFINRARKSTLQRAPSRLERGGILKSMSLVRGQVPRTTASSCRTPQTWLSRICTSTGRTKTDRVAMRYA